MKFTTAGELRRLDLVPLVELVPALWDEWAGLDFDRDGRLTNPLTREVVETLAVVQGRHRQPGAVYRVTVTTPKMDLPESRRAEFDEEARKLGRRNATQGKWEDHHARRQAAMVQVGTVQEEYTATLRQDDGRRLAFTVSAPDDLWSIDVDVEHGRLPTVRLDGRLDLTARLRADGTPGCLASLLGGAATAAATCDPGTLERSGRTVEGEGRANRFRGSALLDVRTSATRWTVDGRATLRARGLGRLVLLLAAVPLRRSFDRAVAEFWASSAQHLAEVEREIARLRAAIEEEGGAAPFLRRALWDDEFAPGIGSTLPDRPER